MAGTLPPLFIITSSDHSGYIAVALYTFLLTTLLVVTARVFTRYYVVKTLRLDDYLLILSTLLYLTQCIILQLCLSAGLGRKVLLLTHRHFLTYEKYSYASSILQIAVICAAKVSLVLLIQSLTSEGRKSLLAARVLLGVSVAWGVASVIAIAFPCPLPRPWDWEGEGGRCVNRGALMGSVLGLSAGVDAALVVLPVAVLWDIGKVATSKRWKIMTLFSTRILVCIATAVQLHYVLSAIHSPDQTWTNITPVIWGQASLALSILTTAIPSLGRLIVELQPAVGAFAITHQHGMRKEGDNYVLSSFAGRIPREYALSNRLGFQTSVVGGGGMAMGLGMALGEKRDRDWVGSLREEEDIEEGKRACGVEGGGGSRRGSEKEKEKEREGEKERRRSALRRSSIL